MPLDLLLFDLGSILIYSKDPWPPIFAQADKALLQVLSQAGIHLDRSTFYAEFETFIDLYIAQRDTDLVEHTTEEILRDLLAQKGHASAPDVILRSALDAMYAVTQENWYVEEDALPTLQKLKERGYRMGLISNAGNDRNVQTLVDRGGFRPFFEFAVTSAACGRRKPHPGIFQLALDHFGIQPADAVMIGDTLEADILGANRLGIYSVWITRRAAMPPDGELPIQPQAVVSLLADIPALLENL